jgi:hypothetical protein
MECWKLERFNQPLARSDSKSPRSKFGERRINRQTREGRHIHDIATRLLEGAIDPTNRY